MAMSHALKIWPLLTGTQRYEKIVSTRDRGQGQFIDAPILAVLVETPVMTEEQRIPAYLRRLGLAPADVDIVFLGHLHFDHAGGLCDLPGCEVHVHRAEIAAAATGLDGGVFADEVSGAPGWKTQSAPGFCWQNDYALALGAIRRLKALARSENAELWPSHDFPAYRRWPAFPAWRD
jgi:N-acyl homoserine lactone hydrolase